jgi:hypothetical protein
MGKPVHFKADLSFGKNFLYMEPFQKPQETDKYG